MLLWGSLLVVVLAAAVPALAVRHSQIFATVAADVHAMQDVDTLVWLELEQHGAHVACLHGYSRLRHPLSVNARLIFCQPYSNIGLLDAHRRY